MMNHEKFFSLEEKYWELSKKINLEEYINPNNIQKEKKVFFEKLNKQLVYNPVFTYKPLDFNVKEIKILLLSLKKVFELSENILSSLYIKKIDNDLLLLDIFLNRTNYREKYATQLTSLYGIPSYEFYNQVKILLEKLGIPTFIEKDITPEETQKIFNYELKKRKLFKWKVLIEDIPSLMSVNSLEKIIKINKNKNFSQEKIKSLVVHEIDTHIQRYENGCYQKYKIFQYGFPDYLETEEGLAILSEDKNDVLRQEDLLVYYCRVIGAYYANKTDFYGLFQKINNYTMNKDLSYSITARTKRGLTDTSLFEGYTKDQVYIKGYFNLKELNNNTLSLLYIGKIGLNDLLILNEIEIADSKINLPNWLKK